MSTQTWSRLNGGALLFGSLIAILSFIGITLLFPSNDLGQYRSVLWQILTLTTCFGSLLDAMGLSGMYASRATRLGRLGLVGVVLIFVAACLFASLFLVLVLVFPVLATTAPRLTADGSFPALSFSFILVDVLLAGGAALFGIAILRSRSFPRWTGWLLVASIPFVLLDAAPLPDAVSSIFGLLALVVIMLGLAGIGYVLVADRNVTATYISKGAIGIDNVEASKSR